MHALELEDAKLTLFSTVTTVAYLATHRDLGRSSRSSATRPAPTRSRRNLTLTLHPRVHTERGADPRREVSAQ
jgi:hypothetical protein